MTAADAGEVERVITRVSVWLLSGSWVGGSRGHRNEACRPTGTKSGRWPYRVRPLPSGFPVCWSWLQTANVKDIVANPRSWGEEMFRMFAAVMALTLTACQMGPASFASATGNLQGARTGAVNIGATTGPMRTEGQKQETEVDANYAPGFGTPSSASNK